MIKLTRLDGSEILLNELFIELVEEAPDTVVSMQNGHHYLVRQSIDDILAVLNGKADKLPSGKEINILEE